jgi:hypothetical protein
LITGRGAKRIIVDGETWGEILSVDDATIKQDWFLPCAFAQTDLVRAAYHLTRGRLWLPPISTEACITLTTLNTLGKLGPDRRDLKDAFDDVSSPTPYMLISGRIRLNTQSLMAVYLPQPVLSNVWWFFALKSDTPT